MLRCLLHVTSIVCLAACAVLIGMWVRSYWRSDHFSWRITDTWELVAVLESGRILWRLESGLALARDEFSPRNQPRPDWGWTTTSYPIGSFEIPGVHGGWSTQFGFVAKSDVISKQATVSSVVLPYWFSAPVSG